MDVYKSTTLSVYHAVASPQELACIFLSLYTEAIYEIHVR